MVVVVGCNNLNFYEGVTIWVSSGSCPISKLAVIKKQEMHPKTLELVPLNYTILINKTNTIYRIYRNISNTSKE